MTKKAKYKLYVNILNVIVNIFLNMVKRGNCLSKFNSSQGFEKIKDAISKKPSSVHFIGVGGVSMYSLFNFTSRLGIAVSGSDKSSSERTEKLIKKGFDVKVPENREALLRATLAVYSLAVSENDSEIRLAEELGIPLVSRAEYLAYVSEEYKTKISVSGSHGKSTVTAMITKILSDASLSPSALSGAALAGICEPYIFGKRDYLVFEGCEYKDSFLRFSPDFSVFLNLELDHTDYFKSFDDIKRSFFSAMQRADTCVVNKDDAELFSLAVASGRSVKSFGIENDADFSAKDLKSDCGFYSFSVLKDGKALEEIKLSVLGRFSVYNALAAFSLAFTLGVEPSIISKSLSQFSGIERRLELIGKKENGAPIIYDYAHHPSEIKSGIMALRESYKGKITVVFKPHTYTRTRDLFDEFAISLGFADKVYLSAIDAIRETEIEGVSSENLARAIGGGAKALSDEEIAKEVSASSDAVIIMGAANLDKIKRKILANNF